MVLSRSTLRLTALSGFQHPHRDWCVASTCQGPTDVVQLQDQGQRWQRLWLWLIIYLDFSLIFCQLSLCLLGYV